MRFPLALLAAAIAATPAVAAEIAAQRAEVLKWREARAARLAAPDGWLSLVGLHWIDPGTHRVGSAPDNDLVLAVGPARLGTLSLADGKITLVLGEDVDAKIGDDAARETVLAPDTSGAPTIVRLGAASFSVIERDGRFGLRVRDPQAKTRTGFVGIDYFDIGPDWRFEARFEPHPPGRTIDIVNVLDQLAPMKNPGAVVFEKDGKEYRLEALDDTGDGQLFLIFADRTNGKSTYGPGRFLYAPPPVDGRTIVDFNRAYNPPCAFTPYSTCPLPPPENRLNLAVEAGEKKYAAATH
jgi:uncharacterized protein (DUF1684 family)